MFFRAGTRKNEQMQPIVEQLNNDDIRNLGAYFASLPPPKNPKPDDNPDLSKKGAQAAAGRRCASCHTNSYAGTKAVARIAGQREEYLVKALHDYKSGVRSGGGMAAMADVAYPLHEEEIEALAHYLAHFRESQIGLQEPHRALQSGKSGLVERACELLEPLRRQRTCHRASDLIVSPDQCR